MATKTKTDESPKLPAISYKGDNQYMQWVRDVAKQDRCKIAQLLDRALECYAESKGYPRPPIRNG